MAQENTNATEGYQMKTGWGTIAMLISATGMGLVPLFSRWATRTDMFDGTLGLNAGDSIGALMACGRMGMGVLFFVILMVATHKVLALPQNQPNAPLYPAGGAPGSRPGALPHFGRPRYLGPPPRARSTAG